MAQLEGVHDIWMWLIQDIAVFGNFQSPLVSWLGAAGIVSLCLWHGVALLRGVQRIRSGVERLEPRLQRLVQARQAVSSEWISLSALAKKPSPGNPSSPSRRDLDDLEELDRMMRNESIFAHEWLSFRKTFVIDHPSWFMEPSVHAGKSAVGFFPFETVCADRLNVRFYQQLPSILTGIGLLFTFVAILIGLSKLHANGSEIEGIQGLINGLAGKFVTSIVGLACGNAFLILEKSLWHRLAGRYRRMVSLLDEVFPRQVQESGSRTIAVNGERVGRSQGREVDVSLQQQMEGVQEQLQAAVEALNVISHSMTTYGNRDSAVEQEQFASRVGKEIRHALSPVLDSIRSSMDGFNRAAQLPRSHSRLSSDDMEELVELLSARTPSEQPLAAASDGGRTRWRFPRMGRGDGGRDGR
ncbi:MAG: hypothetical protein OEY86_00050 [Nitrospira sp.]|nr:hypothetical protein [Nitrospira sp.]